MRPHIFALGALVDDVFGDNSAFILKQAQHRNAWVVIEDSVKDPSTRHRDIGAPVANTVAVYAANVALFYRACHSVDPDFHRALPARENTPTPRCYVPLRR
jgi:hypothetical protein